MAITFPTNTTIIAYFEDGPVNSAASITPTEGSYLYAFVNYGSDTAVGSLADPNIEFNGAPFTKILGPVEEAGGAPDIIGYVFRYLVPATPGTHPVTWDDNGQAGSVGEVTVNIVEVAGADATLVDSDSSSGTTATSAAGVLTGTAGNTVLGWVAWDDQNDTIAWDSPLTAINEIGGTGGRSQSQLAGSIGTVDASPSGTWTNSYDWLGWWIELTETATGLDIITGTLTYTGQVLTQAIHKAGIAGAIIYTGQLLTQGISKAGIAGALTYTGNVLTKASGSTIVSGALSYTGQVFTQTIHKVSVAGALTYTGFVASKGQGIAIISGTLVYAGNVPTYTRVLFNKVVSVTSKFWGMGRMN